jgi:hypothetical protein
MYKWFIDFVLNYDLELTKKTKKNKKVECVDMSQQKLVLWDSSNNSEDKQCVF